MQTLFRFVKDNLPWLLSLLVLVLSTIKNRFFPATEKSLLGDVIDVLSFLAKPNMKGVLGPLSLPGVPSQEVTK